MSLVAVPDLINYVTGVKAWNSDPTDDLLHSGFGVWLPGPNEAVCFKHATHTPPALDCGCGLYAYHGLKYFETNGYYGDVYGIIAAWGEIAVAKDGFRSQFAQVVLLSTPICLGKGTEKLQKIADNYEVELVQFHELEERAQEFGDWIPNDMRPHSKAGKLPAITGKIVATQGVATKPAAVAKRVVPALPAPMDTPTITYIGGKPCVPRSGKRFEGIAALLALVSLIVFVIAMTAGSFWPSITAFLAAVALAKYAD